MTLSPLRLFASLLLALCLPFAGAAELQIQLDSDNERLESNIRAFIGDPGDRSVASLRRFSSHARERARQAMRALGYYRARVSSRVLEQEPPVLQLEVTPGEPVRFRRIAIEVRGEADRKSVV